MPCTHHAARRRPANSPPLAAPLPCNTLRRPAPRRAAPRAAAPAPPPRRPRTAPAPPPRHFMPSAYTKRTPRRPSPSLQPRLSTANLCGASQAHHRRLLVWLCGACPLCGAAAAPARALSLGRARAAREPVCAGRRLSDATHARAVAGGKRGLRPYSWPGHTQWLRLCGSSGPGGSGAYYCGGPGCVPRRLAPQLVPHVGHTAPTRTAVTRRAAFGAQEPCLMHAWRSDWNVSQLPCFDAARFAPAVLRHLTDPLHETSQCFR